MALSFAVKKTVVREVSAIADSSISAVVAEYRGLNVVDMTALRCSARDAGVYVRVVSNTLARRALAGTKFDCMREDLVGPLVFAFSQEPNSAAKVFRDFAKQNGKLVVKLVALDGKLLPPAELHKLAELPNRQQALSLLMAAMLAPVTALTRALSGPQVKLARTVKAIADNKQLNA